MRRTEREHPVEDFLANVSGVAFTALALCFAVWERQWVITAALALALGVPFSMGFGAALVGGFRDGLGRRRGRR